MNNDLQRRNVFISDAEEFSSMNKLILFSTNYRRLRPYCMRASDSVYYTQNNTDMLIKQQSLSKCQSTQNIDQTTWAAAFVDIADGRKLPANVDHAKRSIIFICEKTSILNKVSCISIIVEANNRKHNK